MTTRLLIVLLVLLVVLQVYSWNQSRSAFFSAEKAKKEAQEAVETATGEVLTLKLELERTRKELELYQE